MWQLQLYCHEEPPAALELARSRSLARPLALTIYAIVDFWFFALFLNQNARNVSVTEKRGKISHFLTHCEKRESWWRLERSVGIIRATPRF